MALKINVVKRDPGVFMVTLGGSLDSATFLDLDKQLVPLLVPTTKALMFDLKDLEYISSMGVSELLKAKRVTEEHGGNFMLVNVQPQVNEVFRIIRALNNGPVFKDIEEADRYFIEIQKRIKEENDRKRTL